MSKKKKVAKTLGFYVLIIILIALVVAFLPKILNMAGYVLWLFAPFIVAYGLSLIANPMADGLQKRFRLPRGISAVLVIVLTVGVIGGIAGGIIWKIVDEIRNIYEDLPVIYMNIRTTWTSISESVEDVVSVLPKEFQTAFEDVSDQFLKWLADFATNTELVRSAGNIAKKLPNIFIASVVFILSLYFMVSDSAKVSAAVKKPFSEKTVAKMAEFRMQIKQYVGGYVKAQLMIMCVSFTIILIGLSIIKVDYALIIALATAIFDALPVFGSGAVLIPWAIVSLITGNVLHGIVLVIIYLSVVLTRQFIEPKIVSKNIGMHPILTLMSMYVGFKIFSVGGMILGPLVTVIVISLYRTGVFDGVINSVRKIIKKFCREIKSIKNSLEDEGE